jgi:hypothetical protein
MTAARPSSERPPSPRTTPWRVNAAREIFTGAGLTFQEGDKPGDPWTIAGGYLFWPETGMWRTVDEVVTGFEAGRLVAAIRAAKVTG